MSEPRPFVRVYHDDFQRDYPEVYADDALLATWLRLLVVADKMWPALPELPRSSRRRSVDALTSRGLIERVGPHCFRVKGHHKERAERSDAARNAAAMRWQSARIADAHADAMPSRAQPDQTRPDQDEAWLRAWLSVKMRMPTAKQRTVIERYLAAFDVTGDARAARLILSTPDDPIGALMADLDAFRQERLAEAAAQEKAAKDRHRAERRGISDPVTQELARLLASKERGAA